MTCTASWATSAHVEDRSTPWVGIARGLADPADTVRLPTLCEVNTTNW
ncbi:MAG: hypothetical protein M0Z82_18760 [Actinomycetota bacterium]|nr:hypothetical protein [Actinomycetota bacterium]